MRGVVLHSRDDVATLLEAGRAGDVVHLMEGRGGGAAWVTWCSLRTYRPATRRP